MSVVASPVPLSRTRRQLAVFTAATVVAVVAGMPGWTVAALALTTVGITVAVLLVGGGSLLRDVLRLESAAATRRRSGARTVADRGRYPLVPPAAPEPRRPPRWPRSTGAR